MFFLDREAAGHSKFIISLCPVYLGMIALQVAAWKGVRCSAACATAQPASLQHSETKFLPQTLAAEGSIRQLRKEFARPPPDAECRLARSVH